MAKEFEPIMRENLLRWALALAKIRNVKLATISREFYGDTPIFDDLAKGRGGFTAAKYDKVMALFEEKWPDGHDRPPIVYPEPDTPTTEPVQNPDAEPQRRFGRRRFGAG